MTATDGLCPTWPNCVLAGPRHDDWMHADADGYEWPVTPDEVTQWGEGR